MRTRKLPVFGERTGRSWMLAFALISVAFSSRGTESEQLGSALEPGAHEVAAHRGLSLEQARGLRERFGLSSEAIVRLPESSLRPLLWQLAHPGMDLHAEAIKFRSLRLRDENGEIPANAWMKAAQQRREMPSDSNLWPPSTTEGYSTSTRNSVTGSIHRLVAGIQPSGWTWLGPGNIGGRVRALLIHPTAQSTMWAGGVDGGVWKTTDGGTSWSPLNDFMANLAVSCLVMDPNNPNTIYAGTGEGFHNIDAIRGAGIFKSANGGTSWSQLASTTTSDFQFVNRLAVNPTNGSVMLAATGTGIFRTTDGGATWSKTRTGETLDLQMNPNDGTFCIAGGSNGDAYYSTDAGATWTGATGLGAGGGRVELRYARSDPNTVYVSYDNNSGEVYGSTDGGHSYTLKNTGMSYLESQGWYDNVIWVDPTNPNILIVGGIDLWRSTDGGTTLIRISQWFSAPAQSAHADHHVVVNHPGFDGVANKTIFTGNDGGVYRASDAYTVARTSGWRELNNNLGITQLYGAAGNPTNGVIIGGTQDNGTIRYRPSTGTEAWTEMFGGDGGFCAADPTDPNYFYGEYVDLQIHRSTDGGANSSFIDSGIGDAGQAANFIAPFILDPNNPNTMLAGGARLWRSTNVKAPTPSWSSIKSSTSSHISAIAVAPGTSDIIWVGHNNGDIYYSVNGTASSPSWTLISSANLPRRYCTRLTVPASNPNTVYATFGGFNSGNVWRSTNNGATWGNISGNLPSAPVNSLVVHPLNGNLLYVGTEVGVFASQDGGTTWSTSNDGPANVAVDELFWMGPTLIAATHGRGVFSITPSTPPTITSQPQPANLRVLAGMPVSFSVSAAGSAPLSYQWRLNANKIIGATTSIYSLASAQTGNAGTYSVVVANLTGSVTSSNVNLSVIPALPLPFALNTTNFNWITDAARPWYGQSTVSHDQVASAKSYFITDGQQTSLRASLTGPGILNFWWKVSSQTNADTLTFTDSAGGVGSQVSGEVDWQQQLLYLPSGAQTLQWTYSKDASTGSGSDAAYVDQVSFTPGATAPFITTQPLGKNTLAAFPVTFTVQAGGTPPLGYQWRFNGMDIAGAIANSYTLLNPGAADLGVYSVRVSNAYGSIVSTNAYLGIVPLVAEGDNSLGQINVSAIATNAIAVAAGSWHSLALRSDGSVLAWGQNYDGQCNVPANLNNAMVIAAGGYHSLALRLDGRVTGWGANYHGQVTIPPGLSNVTALAAGTWHSLALKKDGTVVAWGDNSLGQTAVPAGLTKVVAVAAGGNHSLALRSDGTVVAFGENTDALGGFAGQSVVPQNLNNVVAIGAGTYHSLAVRADGTVAAWGDNSQDQCQTPAGLSGVVGLTGGGGHSVALKADSTVVGWGNNWNGQSTFPALVTNVVEIATGDSHTLLLLGQPASAPRLLRPSRSATQFRALVQTLWGKQYTLEFSPTFPAALWTPLSIYRGNGTLQFVADENANGSQGFYRIHQQ